MNVLMISTDRTLFTLGSPARLRIEEYANVLGKLSVIVYTPKGFTRLIGEKLSLYPTNSFSRIAYVSDAVRIGTKLSAPDVVSAQDPFETGLAGITIARSFAAPLHVQVHTNFLARGFLSQHFPLNMVRRAIAWYVIRNAARIRTVSELIMKAIEEKYHPSASVSVLPIFTDLEKYQHIPRTHHPRYKTALLVVSRLEREKRIDVALQAFKKALDQGFDLGLIIVGTGTEERKLKHLAKGLGIEGRVEFVGYQNNLIPYYGMADLLLYPGASYEGFGLAVIEALSAGVPVLSRDVGISREAGAHIAEGDFGDALVAWLRTGERGGQLRYTPYANKAEYLRKFQEDLALSIVPHV